MSVNIRYLPSAMTPISIMDIGSAITDQKDGLSRFKDAINSYLEAKESYTFTSFMRSIYACLMIVKDLDPRREVILPRFSCPTFTHAIREAGLTPLYCDINPLTLSMDMEKLQGMDLNNALAIISVNHFGLANPMDQLAEISKEKDIYLIEDLGYSLGTRFKKRKLGTFGDFSVLNFKEGKAIPIGGGMLTTSHDGLMDLFRDQQTRGSNVGRMIGYRYVVNPYIYFLFKKTMDLFQFNERRLFSMEDTIRGSMSEFDYQFDASEPLYALSDFQGRLGLRIFSRFEDTIRIRETNARFLEDALSDCTAIELVEREEGTEITHYIRYPVRVPHGLRYDMLHRLLGDGVEARDIYSEVKPDGGAYPGAYKVSQEILTLPCHPGMNTTDLQRTINTISAFEKSR
ncbi:DegT/DnrJ/EryC1/StrS family aminotransferase [Methanocalculus sp.]|uniref:DegT/DnrJ/EryC1/StrS family aminotransferase n=1 Tax=Methanocalculus sp. TaxID=2004547 RepID=UPI0026103DE9|nr:DegT/DnrJ/EryC1/StrS family aminotransferase [Methanocalculus sp.]MDG6250468.1 DegT/DnrJ/EryC1/StrS family aminotransferase [Methanocalculus sp.]